jgi:hypothetical protein
MDSRNFVPLIAAAAIAALTACGKPADTVEKKTQVTTTSPQGKVETKEETKQVGSTLEIKTETKSKTDEGTVKTNVQTFVGTVTVYEAGKKIEVLTGENTRHSIELDGKNVQVSIVGPVAVGARVRLVEEKGDRGTRVSVTVEGR